MSNYTHEGQQRILQLVQLLAGHEMNGLAPAEIARQQSCSASLVTRDLDNLRTAGFAEQVPESSRWRLSPELVQIGLRYLTTLDRAERKLDELKGRYTRGTDASPEMADRFNAK